MNTTKLLTTVISAFKSFTCNSHSPNEQISIQGQENRHYKCVSKLYSSAFSWTWASICPRVSQQKFTCSKPTIKTLGKSMKYVQSYRQRQQKDVNEFILSLLLTLCAYFTPFSGVSIVNFELVNVFWDMKTIRTHGLRRRFNEALINQIKMSNPVEIKTCSNSKNEKLNEKKNRILWRGI